MTQLCEGKADEALCGAVGTNTTKALRNAGQPPVCT